MQILLYFCKQISCNPAFGMEKILHYFPNLSKMQIQQFVNLQQLYEDWNAKINVISRKDIGQLYTHHVLHSLAIAKIISFRDGTQVIDVGCGGGFPGIPLAILFPYVHFHLIDSIGKKVLVARSVAEAISLDNVTTSHARVEDYLKVDGLHAFDFVVSRAVMPLPDLHKYTRQGISRNQHNSLPNGIIALKGGNISAEIAAMRKITTTWDISDFFSEEWFEGKKIVHLSVS